MRYCFVTIRSASLPVRTSMQIADFEKLLARTEGEVLDFKEVGYDLTSSTGRNSFTLDLLALANTPRGDVAHIVLGVRSTPEDGAKVIGLERQYDDVDFQNAIGQGRVTPHPRFNYTPLKYQDKQVGVIQIHVDNSGPYTSTKDFDGPPQIFAGAVYYRSGSRNSRASGDQIRRIVDWFLGREGVAVPDAGGNPWRTFLHAVCGFEAGRHYILVADRFANDGNVTISALGLIPWRAVIDFDPKSEESGLLTHIGATLEGHRVIHRVVRGEYSVQPEPGTHWFFARGLAGRDQTIETGPHTSWVKVYKRELGKQLEQLQAALSPAPISVIVLWSQPELRQHLRTLLEELNGSFGDLAELLVISAHRPEIEGVCQESGVAFAEMSLRSLSAGIGGVLQQPAVRGAEKWALPLANGAPLELNHKDALWLSEELELVHVGIGLAGADSPDDFRRGSIASWRNLQLHHDCDRDLTAEIRTQTEDDLRRRQTVRINLYHAPGAGGSTVGRRVIWDLHERYPTVVLRVCDPRATTGRIAKIAALTENAVLLLVDGGEIPERDIDDLYEVVKSQHIPLVIVQVLRRFDRQKTGRRQFWLDAHLSDLEVDRLRFAYAQASPARANDLAALASTRRDLHRTAFYFGLTAFGKEFRGLESYVEARLNNLTELQRRMVVYTSIAHYYGQQAIPCQSFAALLGTPRSRRVDLHEAFSSKAQPVLELLLEVGKGESRTAHHFIALEILTQILGSGPSAERRRVWKQNLSLWAKDFASFCRGADHVPAERMLELVRRVCVYRDNAELLGTERSSSKQFAQLVQDIPSTHGKIEVLRHLAEEFPEEAHFHAHLGRLLGTNGEFDQALEEVDRAIALQPNDSVLHHVRGMILRYEIRQVSSDRRSVETIIDLARMAQASFEESRRLSNDIEHGYISEIQMLIAVLDYAGGSANVPIQLYVSNTGVNPFLRGALDRAEELLDRVQNLYVGEALSPYAADCRARLERLYQDFPQALQAWDSLLARPDVAKPPVRRQIVWTILRRHSGAWDELTTREVDRVQRLLDENLEEEVNDSTSLRLWLRAIRQAERPPSLDSVIERVAYWKANTGSLDAAYYLYVLHALRALEGSGQALADSERALEECQAIARFRRDRTRSFEWIGPGDGIRRLVHQSGLGAWRDDFWESTAPLARVEGRIKSIDAPQKGSIQVKGGLDAFFVPARGGFHTGRDENVAVSLYLGFSYDGPRAWSVEQT